MSTILIVDDESAMRQLYARAIVANGYLTLESRTAEEALDFLAMTPDIHVVVADLEMPGHGGAWLVDQLRDRYPDVAVILATASDAVPGTLSLRPSVVKYLVKPIAPEDLRGAVEEALVWHRQSPPAAGVDRIESWLDSKLTRGGVDDDNPQR
jgi:two-component system, response regulator FlrC